LSAPEKALKPGLLLAPSPIPIAVAPRLNTNPPKPCAPELDINMVTVTKTLESVELGVREAVNPVTVLEEIAPEAKDSL